MKKLISLALTICLLASLFIAAIPTHAAVTLPDATITVQKEVTKTVSLSDMKILSATSALIDSTDSTKLDSNIQMVDSEKISGGKVLKFVDEDAAAGTSGDVIFYYPLTEAQTLKSFSYTTNYAESYYFYPLVYDNNYTYLYRNFFYLHYCGADADTINSCAGKQNIARLDLTPAQITEYVSNGTSTIKALAAASGHGCWPGTFTVNSDSKNNLYTPMGNDVTYTVNFEGEAPVLTVVTPSPDKSVAETANATLKYSASDVKRYPLVPAHIQATKKSTGELNTTYYAHLSDITITYTEEVDVKADVEAFVEANPLALEIRNGLTVADIPSSKLEEYATKAASLKTNYAAADASLQKVLIDYGYYNASLVDLIVNVKDVAATLPDATITALGDVTKVVSLEDMKILSATSGLIDSTDNTKLVNIAITDSNEIEGGKAVTYADANGTLTTGSMVFYYPLTNNETIKSFSYTITYDENYYPYPVIREGNDLRLYRNFFYQHNCGLTDTTGTCAGKQLQGKVDLTSDQIATKVTSSDYSIAALGAASSHGCMPGTFTPAKIGKSGNLSTGKDQKIKYTIDYTGETPTLTVENLNNGDVAVFNYASTTQKHYPMAMAKIQSGYYTHFSDFTITYTAPVDVKAQVAEFVAANPFALDIRNESIDLTGDLTQYTASATSLAAAYSAADEDLQATLTEYGYYDADIIEVFLDGYGAIDGYKTEHATALGISDLAVKDIAASYDTYKALYDAAVADLSTVESYIELGMGADIKTDLDAAEASLAEALEYKGYADLIADGTLKYENDFEGEETLEQVHSLTYPYDEEKAAFADNGKEYVNTTNKIYAIPDILKGSALNDSEYAFGLQNRFYYNIYSRSDLRFANQYSANKYLWTAAKENGLSLDRVTGIFNVANNATGWAYAPAIIFSYTDEDHYSLISINGIQPTGSTTLNTAGMTAGNFKIEEYVYDADNTESPLTRVAAYPTITIGRVAETDDNTTDGWVEFSFTYNEDNTAQFTFINDGHIYSVSTQSTTTAENKFFSMAKLTGANISNIANPIYYAGTLYVDNLEIVFEEDENLAYYAKANDYRVEWEEIFLRNAEYIAPYDVAEVTAAKAAYDALDTKVQAHLTAEGVTAKLTALVNTAATWDLTDDASIVSSYKTNFATIDASNYKLAYNVYNRLTVAQKAELESEYEAMLALFAAEEQADNTTDIVVMGDSNTYGSLLDDAATNRWTTLLGNKLGENYTVSMAGIPGYRLVDDTTNIEGIQFRDDNTALWVQSHTMGFDMVIVALGTNDGSNVNSAEKGAKWEALYEEFVQSYLAVENSPAIVLSTYGRTKTSDLTVRDTAFDYVNNAIRNVAEKYGLAVVDVDAMYKYDADNYLFTWTDGDKNLHWNEAGHEWLAGHYYNAITELTANAYSLADSKVFYDYDAEKITATVNGLAPKIVSATIRKGSTNQDIRFKATISENVIGGKEIAEYGMILADYRNITAGRITLDDMTCDTESDYIVVGRSAEASNDDLGITYYVNVGGLDDSTYGAPIIARAYVKYTDGTVYYSVNTSSTGDYANRTGVKDGYAVRSVISITKAMLIDLNKYGVDVSKVVKIENNAIVAYITAEGAEANKPDDTSRLFSVIAENASVLENR